MTSTGLSRQNFLLLPGCPPTTPPSTGPFSLHGLTRLPLSDHTATQLLLRSGVSRRSCREIVCCNKSWTRSVCGGCKTQYHDHDRGFFTTRGYAVQPLHGPLWCFRSRWSNVIYGLCWPAFRFQQFQFQRFVYEENDPETTRLLQHETC